LRTDGQPSNERVPFNLSPDHFPYGYSKVLAERVVQEAVSQGQDIVTVNPVIVMGSGDLNMISGSYIVQIKKLARLVPVPPGGIAVIDVRDVARMHLAAAESGRSGERYILNTANYTQREWMGMIADVVGVKRPFITAPAFVLPIAANIIDFLRRLGIQTPIDGDQTRLGAKDIHFDGSKAWAELGEPQVEMLTSLQDTYRWYRENGYL
jgi:dihydroflavonol-4-reductase